MKQRLEIAPGVFRDAGSNVLEIASEAAVDQAWDAFSKLASRLRNDPELLSDRAFMEELTRAEQKWKRLFLIQENGSER